MKRKLTIASCAAVSVIFLCALLWSGFGEREPRYGGRSLSEWARIYGSNHWSTVNRELAAEAQFAIQAIGTNGIPFLLKQIGTRESILKREAIRILPAKWQGPLHLRDDSGEIRRAGAQGIAALGPNAVGAIPQLIRLARTHPDEDGRYVPVFALRTLENAAEPAMPFFFECLTNQDMIVRDEAVIALGCMTNHADLVIPALVQHLQRQKASTHIWELSDALGSLGQFGNTAQAAAPEVSSLLRHSDQQVREAATNCLLRIDAKTADKAHSESKQE